MRETLKVRRGVRAKYASASGIEAVRNAIDSISGGKPITVGFIGSPNAGKSSLINALCGSHVVSESKTPGHTKHFQTIKLTQEITLCDCPGLVFPLAGAPKGLQVIAGCYPIAHLREPHEAMRYAAERVPLHVLCGAADAGTPAEVGGGRDARAVLQDVVRGRVPLYWTPPRADTHTPLGGTVVVVGTHAAEGTVGNGHGTEVNDGAVVSEDNTSENDGNIGSKDDISVNDGNIGDEGDVNENERTTEEGVADKSDEKSDDEGAEDDSKERKERNE